NSCITANDRRALTDAISALPDDMIWSLLDEVTDGLLLDLDLAIPDQTAVWRQRRMWLVELLGTPPSERLKQLCAAVPDSLISATIAAFDRSARDTTLEILQNLASPVRGDAAGMMVRAIEAHPDPRKRLDAVTKLLGVIVPDFIPAVEEMWLNAACALARTVTTESQISALGTSVLEIANHLAPRAQPRVGEVLRSIGSPVLHLKLLTQIFADLPATLQPTLAQGALDVASLIAVRTERVALLLGLARVAENPARRMVLEETLRMAQLIDDGIDLMQALVSLTPWT